MPDGNWLLFAWGWVKVGAYDFFVEEIVIVTLIAAMAKNRVIGLDRGIPWDIPADRRRFRELTMGHPVIMGRKTFESIGRPLPGRRCIVLSRQPGYAAPGCEVKGSIEEALRICSASDEVFVAGGGELYRLALPLAERLCLTYVDLDLSGDTTFPEIPDNEFEEKHRELVSEDPGCTLVVYERRHAAN